jgi:hypothetical protein
VAALRERPGRDVNIIAVDLVDELSLMIEPILLGGGRDLPGRRCGASLRATTTPVSAGRPAPAATGVGS